MFRSSRVGSILGLTAAMVGCIALSGCSDDSGPPTLNWYINPDNGGQATRAQQCADASNGAYKVSIQTLPTDATQQREQLVRRLAAKDSSIDAMSLDIIYTAEFANAGFLRPYTAEETVRLTAGMLPAPIETGIWKDTLYATPIKSNAQLLWYRKSLVAQAGLDPNSPTFTWDVMQKAAVDAGKKISVPGARYEGFMVWINALVLSGGGQILTDPEAGKDAVPSMAGPAGDKAAEIVGNLARSSAAPSDLTTAMEEQARAVFQGDNGMFMTNWPYIYAAARTAVEEGTLNQSVVDDIGWARYPRVSADRESGPPLGGANMAIGAYSKHPDLAVQLAECATSVEKATQYMLDEGEPSPFSASYDDPRVREEYPFADLIRESIAQGGPRPITPFYVDVAGSVINTWHPANSVGPSTPAETDSFMADVLSGKRLL
ncbi:extracellular solute-binding protein [Aldersonia kunmingensis]|uniref:extracellular solute-binding protein n=1 Tax=Aldersonia kunmingensis TaxID=408066 RepID=UPI000AF65DF1|nr:extracellular solute-binding protein [Aldersonia kunmingensis]